MILLLEDFSQLIGKFEEVLDFDRKFFLENFFVEMVITQTSLLQVIINSGISD